MPPLEIPLFDLVIPALLALAVLAWAWRKREGGARSGEEREPRARPTLSSSGSASTPRLLGSVAFGAALLFAWWSNFREFALPSSNRVLAAKDWIPWCIVAAVLAAGIARVPAARRFVPSGGAPIVLALLVVLSMRTHLAQGGAGQLHALAAFLVAMGAWAALELSSERLRGPLPALVLALACSGSAVALALGGSTVLGRLCGALAAVCIASAFVARKRRVFTLAGGPVAVISVVLVGSWINAWAFTNVPLSAVVLLAASVIVPGFAGIGPLSTWSAAARETARVLLTAALAGAAVWIALDARPASYGY